MENFEIDDIAAEGLKNYQPELVHKFMSEFWPAYSDDAYSALYQTYHPSSYGDGFNSPDYYYRDAEEAVKSAEREGLKLGLLDNYVSRPGFWGGLDTNITHAHDGNLKALRAVLMFDRFYDIIEEFRCYCGENGIDPDCVGRCLGDFPPLYSGSGDESLVGTLKEDYNIFHDYMIELQSKGFPVTDFIDKRKLKKIYLVRNGEEMSVEDHKKQDKEKKEILDKETEEKMRKIGYIDEQQLSKEKQDLNPSVEVGDVIELIHMDDPYNPIPPFTKGVVMGWDSVGTIGEKMLVRWILDPEIPEFKNMPIIVDADVYRKVETPKPNEETPTDFNSPNNPFLIREELTQEIKYSKIGESQFKGRTFVFFNGPSVSYKDPEAQNMVFNGPNGRAVIDSIYVNLTKSGKAFYVQYDYNTRSVLDPLLNFKEERDGPCNFKWVLEKQRWNKTSWRYALQNTIQMTLNEMYGEYKAEDGKPTEYHIKNGFVNVPGTDAHGTNHGWSILNFFLTNPHVRDVLVKAYQKHINDNNLQCSFNIKEFNNWIYLNRKVLFGMGQPLFKEMVKRNQGSWKRGSGKEVQVAAHLEAVYGEDWKAIYDGEPGIFSDALTGVDIKLVNANNGKELTFQAKSLGTVEEVEGPPDEDGNTTTQWWVESGWLKEYKKDLVSHFVFGPSRGGETYIFKNEGQDATYKDGKEYMVFNEPYVGHALQEHSTKLGRKALREALFSR